MPQEFKSCEISLSSIDPEDRTCLLGLWIDTDAMAASIRRIGLVNRPVLAPRDRNTYAVVCGFRRVEACRRLGWSRIPAKVFPDPVSESDLIVFAIREHRSHRELNVIEQAGAIRKLAPKIPPEKRLDRLSALIGFPRNLRVYQKLYAFGRLSEEIQKGVLKDELSFEGAVKLGGFSHSDAQLLFGMLRRLRLSQNKQKEVLVMVEEIALIEGQSVPEVLESLDLEKILARSDLNRNEKGAAVRGVLKKRRFPQLAAAEKDFKQHVKALKLDPRVDFVPPPYFEGRSYRLQMRFSDLGELEECRKQLDALIDNPAMAVILEPVKAVEDDD